MSYDARQRYRRQKRDPYRGSQIAPSHPMPPVVCADCGHLRGMHADDRALGCLVDGCDSCTEYREATT